MAALTEEMQQLAVDGEPAQANQAKPKKEKKEKKEKPPKAEKPKPGWYNNVVPRSIGEAELRSCTSLELHLMAPALDHLQAQARE